MLELQFLRAECDVVGIQEGRSSVQGAKTGLHFKMYSTCADENGGFGCQCWIRKHPFNRVLNWNAVNPRIMCVAAEIMNSLTVNIVAHAPTEIAEAGVKIDFWTKLDEITVMLLTKYPRAAFNVMIDANGRIGSVFSEMIGKVAPEVENDNGARLRMYAETHRFCVATSFFEQAGFTWTSTHATHARIDFILTRSVHFEHVVKCWTDETIDLTFNRYKDHSLVLMSTYIPGNTAKISPSAARTFKIDKRALCNSELSDKFQADLWKYKPPVNSSLDDHAADAIRFMKTSALRRFGSPKDYPVKPWISMRTWSLLKFVAPMRRCVYSACSLARGFLVKATLSAWHSAARSLSTTCTTSPTSLTVLSPSSPWALYGEAVDAMNMRAFFLKWESRWNVSILKLQKAFAPSLAEDRKIFLDGLVLKAHKAAEENGSRMSFAVVRSLCASRVMANSTVFLADGRESTSKEEEAERWEQHFAKVFHGDVAHKNDLAELQEARNASTVPPDITIDLGPQRTYESLETLGKNKGTGPDAVCAELLHAGGAPAAIILSALYKRVASERKWVIEWTGGEICNVYKKKGGS